MLCAAVPTPPGPLHHNARCREDGKSSSAEIDPADAGRGQVRHDASYDQ